jgi:hypothetical protein
MDKTNVVPNFKESQDLQAKLESSPLDSLITDLDEFRGIVLSACLPRACYRGTRTNRRPNVPLDGDERVRGVA